MKKKEEEFEYFEYKDVDFVNSFDGWLEAKLQNRWEEGYTIWRDVKNLSWKGQRSNFPTIKQ